MKTAYLYAFIGIMIPVGAVVVFASYMMWFYNYNVSPAARSSYYSSSSEQQLEGEGVRWILCFHRRPLSQHIQSSSASAAATASNHHDSKQPLSAELKNNSAAALQSIIVHVVEPDGSSCVATNDTACSV